jgi:regulator of sigma E protease
MTILATIIVLGVLIFVHELGHFLAARSVGIRVERFSIGLGPRVWGYRRGETEYVLSAIPLGGYVKMGGMDDEVMEAIEGGKAEGVHAMDDPGGRGRPEGTTAASHTGPEAAALAGRRARSSDFDSKPVWARAWVISAGVTMNMVFAFLAYTAVAAGWGSAEPDTTRVGLVRAASLTEETRALAEIPTGARLVQVGDHPVSHWGEIRAAVMEAPEGPIEVSFAEPEGSVELYLPREPEERQRVMRALTFWTDPEIAFVHPGTPADRAGFRRGDRIAEVDGEPIVVWTDFQAMIEARPERETAVAVERDGARLVLSVTPDAVHGIRPDGEERTVGQIGVQPAGPGVAYSPVPPLQAVRVGWDETVFVTGFILGFLRDLVTGQVSARNLGSIVTIGEASGQAAAEGIPVFLSFMALFSINLAILNLLPIPVLDGGHLVFLTIEAVRGRPVSVEQRLRWSQVGFVILIGIMALALGNDFLRLFGL